MNAVISRVVQEIADITAYIVNSWKSNYERTIEDMEVDH